MPTLAETIDEYKSQIQVVSQGETAQQIINRANAIRANYFIILDAIASGTGGGGAGSGEILDLGDRIIGDVLSDFGMRV